MLASVVNSDRHASYARGKAREGTHEVRVGVSLADGQTGVEVLAETRVVDVQGGRTSVLTGAWDRGGGKLPRDESVDGSLVSSERG